jgi:hypothetical protein
MRAIILIQAIIIVLGAYYIYTMSHAVKVEQSPVPVVQMIPATTTNEVHPGYVPPTTQPPSDVPPATTSKSVIKGPNDAGMEYPTNPDVNYPDQPIR